MENFVGNQDLPIVREEFSNNESQSNFSQNSLNNLVDSNDPNAYQEVQSIPYIEDPQIENLLKMIKIHETYLKMCMTTHKYIEAEETLLQIRDLKVQVVKLKSKELDRRHNDERRKLEELQSIEMRKLIDFWQEKIENNENNARNLMDAAIEKQKIDILSLEEELRTTLRLKPKINPERIKYKKTLENLVRAKEFVQAEQIRHICLGLEKEEFEKAEEVRDSKIKSAILQLSRKQNIELNVLEARIEAGLLGLKRAMDSEISKQKLRFQNMQKEVTRAQQAERVKFDGVYKNYVPRETLKLINRNHRPLSATRNQFVSNQKKMTPMTNRSVSPVSPKGKLEISTKGIMTPLKNRAVTPQNQKSPYKTPPRKGSTTPSPRVESSGKTRFDRRPSSNIFRV